MDPNECLLRNVHGVVRILQHADRELVHAPLVLLDELAEGGGVALLGGPDQLPVIARVPRSLSLARSASLEMGKFPGSPVPLARYQEERSSRPSSSRHRTM